MAEKITQIQIGADVRDIGLGKEATVELGSKVAAQIAETTWGLALDGTRLKVKTGEGLKLTYDTGVELDTEWVFGTMKRHPDKFVDAAEMLNVLAPKMGTFAGNGIEYLSSAFRVNLGSGLYFGGDGKITPNIGTGLKYSGSGEIIPHVNSASGIEINKDLGLTLNTETVGEMLTLEGDGTVISNGSGLCVNYGTGLTIQGDSLIPQVCRGLEIYDVAGESKIGIGVRLGTAMRHGGSPMAIGVDIDLLLTAIQSDERYINTLKAMLGLT